MPKRHPTAPGIAGLLLLAIGLALPLQAANLSLERRISTALDSPSLSGKAVWLENGNNRFLTIYSPSETKLSLGGALILHDQGTHADWAEVVQPLRKHLARQGWNTLALQLPATDTSPDATARLNLMEKASARIQRAIDYFDPQQQPNLVLVGHGLGAAMALHHLAKQPNQRVSAIAAIGLSIDPSEESDPVSQAIAQIEIPILDLYGSRDLPAVTGSAAKRRQIASANAREGYRQEVLNGADHFFSGMQSSLQQRIHTWLKRTSTIEEQN
ncbi:MAG: alpha/beta hydrolase family protein [Candidatus Thiodiazotropha lotti]|nr:alpha/beta hydrolase family protein [Candidatus Thiodiazotropha lotti]MCG7999732.1 alpha/beta hydrolase family protein [Candidatus Thiodiazotropha lotti]MCW4183364.1 alpha/beta hydrolase family protein [Candidatus Thiodiazotropha weberae]MCW4191501.1 alpha/beta hydrolase family protein [Candidatus Thiodiazotropha weberae]